MGNTPNVRFKGFTEDWEQRKLGDVIIDLKSGLSRQLSNIDIGLPVVRANNINDGNLDMHYDVKYWYVNDPKGANTSNYLIHKNDILVNFINSESKMGTTTIVDSEPTRDTIYTTNILRMRTNTELCNNYFLLYKTMTSQYCNYIKSITKPAVNQASFTTVDFKNYSFYIPSIIEQGKIGEYFRSLDNLITLHQQKCDETKEFKKYMLQNMFPQKDEKVPKIRFDGFTGDWEQRKLKEVLSFLKDGTHGTHADTVEGPLLLSAKNIKDGTIRWDESDRRISQDEYEKIHSKFSLKEGDVLLTIVGSIGETAILKDSEGITFQRSVAFLRPNEDISSDFLYAEIQTPAFQKDLESRKSTSAQPGIYLGDLAEISVKYAPSLEEQIKIGEYFEQLDNIITLHQQKCNALKEFKKYMLQNMFPQKGKNKCQN